MKKTFAILFLAPILTLCVFLPAAAFAEDVAAVRTPIEYDWSTLAGVAGASAFTLVVVQFLKAPLDKVCKIPTRALTYAIALLTLLVAQICTVGFTWEGLALSLVNAVVAASAAMGAYEVTFAKAEK